MVYGHANGRDIAETVDEVGRYIDMGYKAIRAQSGIPGLASTYGVSKDRMYYEPADAAIATRTSGRRASISTTRRSSSTRCARASASTITFCTMSIIA